MTQLAFPAPGRCATVAAVIGAMMLGCGSGLQAQVSLGTAVDLALRSNPRVQSAEADVARARAQLDQTHDVYVPAVNAGAGLGQAYGYLPNPPTLFTVTAGSLVYNSSQNFYVKSSRAGLNAAQLALQDAREAVAQDTALAFLALDHDMQRQQVIGQESGYSNTMVTIVQERMDAGQDTQINLTQAKLSSAQLRLAVLRTQDDMANDREHLAHLMGVPEGSLQLDNTFPSTPVPVEEPASSNGGYANSGVASAFANAEARDQQSRGDARFKFRPQVNLVAQYNRYATFTNSFKTLEAFNNANSGGHIGADEAAFGVQISLPFFDKYRSAKARETVADAQKSLHDAQNAQLEALDGLARTRHSIAELQAQADVAALQQQLAQQQLEVLHLQLQAGTGNPDAQQMTPKDEQNAKISERDKYLGVIDASYQLHQAEIQLLRQSGQLQAWLRSSLSASPAGPFPSDPSPTQH